MRGKKHTIYEYKMNSNKKLRYYFHKGKCQKLSTVVEKYTKNPHVLSNADEYNEVYREYYLRFTFLPNPTSLKV